MWSYTVQPKQLSSQKIIIYSPNNSLFQNSSPSSVLGSHVLQKSPLNFFTHFYSLCLQKNEFSCRKANSWEKSPAVHADICSCFQVKHRVVGYLFIVEHSI